MKKKPLTNKSGEVRELNREDIDAMRPIHEVLPSNLLDMLPKRKRGQRGLQKRPAKIAITVRYSPEVIEYFKSEGEGWQKRMNEALKEWVTRHPHTAHKHAS